MNDILDTFNIPNPETSYDSSIHEVDDYDKSLLDLYTDILNRDITPVETAGEGD
ncbi:unnamed protein product, partial [Didymodactylos carnosus]